MKSTVVDAGGNVRCPACGAVNSFVQKRTGKGKILLGIAAPKRLKCSGCGTNLKRGEGTGPSARDSKALRDETRSLAAANREQRQRIEEAERRFDEEISAQRAAKDTDTEAN